MVVAAAVGGLIGAVIGPFALRLRETPAIITSTGLSRSALVRELGFRYARPQRPVTSPIVGPVNSPTSRSSTHLHEGRRLLLSHLILVAVVAPTAKNSPGHGPGAPWAVRITRAAEAIGIRLSHSKVLAFVVSSSLVAMAGALFGFTNSSLHPATSASSHCSTSPRSWSGASARHSGPILGAVHHDHATVHRRFSDRIPASHPSQARPASPSSR
jgi:branched-chain amino acid transport system permease protein